MVRSMIMRNLFCPHYKKCLDRAARLDLSDFDCAGCSHYNDHADLEEISFFPYWSLIGAIFRPEDFRKFKRETKNEDKVIANQTSKRKTKLQ